MTTERDYAEASKAEFDMKIHSEAFGFNFTLSIEESTCENHNKDHNDVSNEVNMKIYFRSNFPDDSAQNVVNTFDHIKTSIHWMYENNLLITDGKLYGTTYVCSKQYKCEN